MREKYKNDLKKTMGIASIVVKFCDEVCNVPGVYSLTGEPELFYTWWEGRNCHGIQFNL